MTHMYFSARAEGRISYGHLGRTNSCLISDRNCVVLLIRQETQLSLTNRATHLCKCNGTAVLKHAPPRVLPCRIWSFCVKGCRHKYGIGKRQNWGALALRILGMVGVSDPKIHAPPPQGPHVLTGLDWPLCHCAMAQAPPFNEHRTSPQSARF